MPIHSLGYRAWHGALTTPILRWLIIAETGVRLAWKNPWLKRVMLLIWLPTLLFAVPFYAFELFAASGRMAPPFAREVLRSEMFFPPELTDAVLRDPSGQRHAVWTHLLLLFFRMPQLMTIVFIVGLITPPLIAQDLRTRAFILYFSRPITRLEYLLGKASTVWIYSLMVTMGPALLLYVGAVLVSPSFSVVLETWDLPLRVIGASACLLLPTTALALAFSAMTTDSRYASFAWFAVWILGAVIHFAGSAANDLNFQAPVVYPSEHVWSLCSLFHTEQLVQRWIFGLEDFSTVSLGAFTLLGITVVGTTVVYRRISSPMRA